MRWIALVQIFALIFLATDLPGQTNERHLADMPDDFEGQQMHLIYATPSDGLDNEYDIDGTLERSVSIAQQWLTSEVSRTWRFDTYQGSPDITFVRLSRPEDVLFQVDDSNGSISFELELLGFDNPDKMYVVFYDGAFKSGPCGGNGGEGGIALQILGGKTNCPFFGFADSSTGPGQLRQGTFGGVMVHEMIHTLGFVASCAPNHDDEHPAHLEGISDDIMAFDGTGFTLYRLDKNRTQYYEHGIPTCLDLSRSSVWTDADLTANPIPGKGETYITLQPIDCAFEFANPSRGGGEESPIRFVNLSQRVVQFYWLGFDGQRNPSERVGYFEAANGGSAGNHAFLATYEDTGECIGVYRLQNGRNQIVIVDETTPEEIREKVLGDD
jgi:hypothetical protein